MIQNIFLISYKKVIYNLAEFFVFSGVNGMPPNTLKLFLVEYLITCFHQSRKTFIL